MSEVTMFGPEYSKIQTLFKRDERNIIVPGDWTTDEFRYLADCEWRWTEKVDGTNIRVHWNGAQVAIGGRTDNAQVPTFLLAALQLQGLTLPEKWAAVFPDADDVTVYGEGYGPKIQKGGQYRDDCALIVFDVRVGQWWLKEQDVADVAGRLDLDTVPLRGTWTLREAVDHIDADRLSSCWPNARLEGLVGTPAVPLFDRRGDRIITKLKVKDFADLRRSRT